MNIGVQLKKLRVEAGLNQSELAEKAGVSVSYVSRLESGDYQTLSLDICLQLASGLGLTLKAFLETFGLLESEKTPNTDLILQNALRSSGFTTKEVKDVLEYVDFIKNRKRHKDA